MRVRARKQVILFSAGFDATVLLAAAGFERRETIDTRMDGRLLGRAIRPLLRRRKRATSAGRLPRTLSLPGPRS